MAMQQGTYVCGVRTLEDLRARCVIREGDDCWHLRTARGKPMPTGQTLRVFAYGNPTSVAARPLAIRLSGRRLPNGWCAVAKFDSYDCINPDHLACHPRGDAVRISAARGEHSTARKTIAYRLQGAKRSRITPELWGWVYESSQSSKAIGHALDIADNHIALKRAKHRQAHMVMGVAA